MAEVSEEITRTIKQIVGLEKNIHKTMTNGLPNVGALNLALAPSVNDPISKQYIGTRKRYGNMVAELGTLPERMAAHKLLKQERRKADTLAIADLPQYKR